MTPPTAAEVLEHRAAWLAALRSGGYAQGVGALRVGDGYCCLGVAEDVRRAPWRRLIPPEFANFSGVGTHVIDLPGEDTGESVALTPDGAAWLGLATGNPVVTVWYEPPADDFDEDERPVDAHGDVIHGWTYRTLAELNDEGLSFAEIATVVADQPADWNGESAPARREADRRTDEGVPAPSYGATS